MRVDIHPFNPGEFVRRYIARIVRRGQARSGRLSAGPSRQDPARQSHPRTCPEKAGWGKPLPKGIGRHISVQLVFATYLAQVAEVEVSKDGTVRVRRVVCAVDCGTVVNPDIVVRRRSRARSSSASRRHFMARSPSKRDVSSRPISTAIKCCASTRRRHRSPHCPEFRIAGWNGRGRDVSHRARCRQRDLCGDGHAL